MGNQSFQVREREKVNVLRSEDAEKGGRHTRAMGPTLLLLGGGKKSLFQTGPVNSRIVISYQVGKYSYRGKKEKGRRDAFSFG